MAKKPMEQFFRDRNRIYPWLIGAAVLIVGAYILVAYLTYPGWAVVAFVAGLVVAGMGVKLVRQPAARLTGRVLTLSDPRGLSLANRVYSLDNIQRVSIETHRQNVPNRMRRGVLLVNMTGVSAERVEVFVSELRKRNVAVSD